MLFQLVAASLRIECEPELVDYLIRRHYAACSRPLRRCHARDLLEQIQNYCEYNEQRPTVTEEHLDYAVRNYFTPLADEPCDRATPPQACAVSSPASASVIDPQQTLVRTG